MLCRVIKNIVNLLIVSFISFFCAGQLPPSGGPIDKEPPTIISTYPAIGTLNFQDNKLVLRFSEYVDRRSVEHSIFISPSIEDLTFDWSGTEVEIAYTCSLRKNTTYVLTVGTDVVDIRNKNRMAKAFTLPFSTGNALDSASISGKIYSSTHEGIMVYAYQLDDKDEDLMNPQKLKPDYLTQTGKDGTFLLSHLANGTYRLIAMKDEFRNLLYDPQTDSYGVLDKDISLSDEVPNVNDIQFLLTSEDTTKPFLSKAEALDCTHVLVRFSKSVDTTTLKLENIVIMDTTTRQYIKMKDVSIIGDSKIDAQFVTSPLDSAQCYLIRVFKVSDYKGNQIDTNANIILFYGSNLVDTTKPYILSINSKDSLGTIMIDDTLTFYFSEAINRTKFENGFAVYDSVGNIVNGKFIWWNSASVSFVFNYPLSWNSRYSINIKSESIMDFNSNYISDKVYVYRFNTFDEKLFGTIEGLIKDENTIDTGNIYIELIETSKKDINNRRIRVNKPGNFKIDRILEGRYTIFAFRDTDDNGTYSFGNVKPFVPSERFYFYPDTIKVRARWPIEGIKLILK